MEALTAADLGAASEIRSAWLSGHYGSTILLLESQRPTAERDLFLAQAYLRAARYEDVLVLLTSAWRGERFTSPSQVAKARAYEAVAHAVRGSHDHARECMQDALAQPVAEQDVQIEVQYNAAYVAWMRGDLESASDTIGRFLAGGNDNVDPSLFARFLMLRGWLFAAQERYTDQVTALLSAIRHLDAAPNRDVGLLAWCVYPLAALVRDIHVPEALETVVRLESSLPWTADLSMPRFQTVRAVAWAYTVQGEYIRAFRKFNAAKILAPNPIAKMLVHLDHASCARFSEQNLVAAAELAEADDLIRTYDWSAAAWEESRALIQAAELMATADPQRAEELLQQANQLRGRMSRNAGYAHDRRLSAHADYAEAHIRQARSDRRVARHRAQRAYEVFAAVGYNWRAAECALLLHELGAEGGWLAKAEQNGSAYPRSFIAEQVTSCKGKRNPLTALTARQCEILEKLCAGETIDAISLDLGISSNTVRVHITRIHRVFNVERRSQLLREVAKYGIAA